MLVVVSLDGVSRVTVDGSVLSMHFKCVVSRLTGLSLSVVGTDFVCEVVSVTLLPVLLSRIYSTYSCTV